LRRFLFLFLTYGFLWPGLSLADFGSADIGDIELNRMYEFNAWCGKARNNCKIIFEDEKIIVDKTNFVLIEQIKAIDYIIQEKKCVTTKYTGDNCLIPIQRDRLTVDVAYIKRSGSSSVARIIFNNLESGQRFLEVLSSFTGVKSLPRDYK
tara:strand:- start:39 stop:491 length:453 start_codon:yes stop_codon:yes gene_type:complete